MTTPSLVWRRLVAQNAAQTATAFVWDNAQLSAGNPPAVSMPVGYTLKATVLAVGSTSTVYTIGTLVNAGSDAFQLTSGTMADLDVGMLVVPVVEAAPPAGLPNGMAIVGVDQPVSGSLQLGGGGYLGQTGAPWIYTQPAAQTIAPDLNVIDEYPTGHLAATVTPTTGTTIVDWNLDGTGALVVGNGSSMSNSGGQACGFFGVTFADTGTYTINVAFTSFDAAYGNTSGLLAVSVS